jgi:hypothetical protein
MNILLRIALWNANGLAQHRQEVQLFITQHKLDILLISETHFTDNNYFKIPNYSTYCTNHPDNTAHGGSAVIIRNTIKHYELPSFKEDYLQASSIVLEDWLGPITLSAVYCPPRHIISQNQFERFFNTLGNRFIAGGDFNAKHQVWGSRLATPRGRQLLRIINENHFNHFSTGEPTYWPTDVRKIPDLLDFLISKGINQNYTEVNSCLDLSSDHSPVMLNISTVVFNKRPREVLYNRNTDWNQFRNLINNRLNLNVPLLSCEDLENAVDYFVDCIQQTAKAATPTLHYPNSEKIGLNYPVYVKRMIAEKRRLRRIWQNSRNPNDKASFNRAAQNLKRVLYRTKNQWFEEYTKSLSATEATDYSLWKATKNLKHPKIPIPPILKPDGNWAKSNEDKSEAFARHFSGVFKPNEGIVNNEEEIQEFLDSPLQLEFPVQKFSINEVSSVIAKGLSPNKTPGYDSITAKILKELPRKGVLFLTYLFNAILRLEHVPHQFKRAQLIVIPKPGKPLNELTSYRPISLLPIMSKVFEKLFLKRLQTLIDENLVIPGHQFGFRQQHGTVEQVHRVVHSVRQCLENKQFCSAVFLDVSQAFDKVWHPGLLYKIKKFLPHSVFSTLKSYLSNRTFQIKYENNLTNLYPIESGIPQGSVLGPFLYVLYTADLPESEHTMVATFADDTAILSVHDDPALASANLQLSLNSITDWFKTWRIKTNENKSAHITFTLNHDSCPPVTINNTQLPQVSHVKYLGMHLDEKLTWKTHIWLKRQQLNLKANKLNWLLGYRSKLSIHNKLLLYKTILKPIWTYGVQLWGSASDSNIEILQRFQSKLLRKIVNAPWFVSNRTLHQDLKIPTVQEEIAKFSKKYISKLENHPNHLALNLLDNSITVYRLKRHTILDLPFRF